MKNREEEIARATQIMSISHHKEPHHLREELEEHGISHSVIEKLVPHEEEEDEHEEKASVLEKIRHNLPAMKKFLRRHKLLSAVSFAAFIGLAALFLEQITAILLVSALFVLGAFSTYYKRKLGVPLGGFELVTFGTVIVGAVYGPVLGAIFGGLGLLATSLLSADISPVTGLGVSATAIAGALAGVLYAMNGSLLITGMLANIFILAVGQLPFFPFADMEVKTSMIFYIVTNLITNLLLFATIGPFVMALLA